MTTRPAWGAASSRTVPSSGFPVRRRTSAGSKPWTIALVTRCTSGSLSRSSTALSSGVSPPACTSRTRLPSASAVSRTILGKRPNTVEIGSSRVSMSVDSRRLSVFCSATTAWSSRSSSTLAALRRASSRYASARAACWMSPSPKTSSIASRRRKSTRTTLAAFPASRRPPPRAAPTVGAPAACPKPAPRSSPAIGAHARRTGRRGRDRARATPGGPDPRGDRPRR